jgi:hypothetical protein
MRVLHERCCGLDVHKRFVVACLLTTEADGTVHKEVRTYSAMTNDLLALADWLRGEDCGPVVMESTGSYWRPVFNLLEGQCEVLVVNAYHAKAVPGRKSDVKDAEWLADLLRHGLLRASFLPASFQRHGPAPRSSATVQRHGPAPRSSATVQRHGPAPRGPIQRPTPWGQEEPTRCSSTLCTVS